MLTLFCIQMSVIINPQVWEPMNIDPKHGQVKIQKDQIVDVIKTALDTKLAEEIHVVDFGGTQQAPFYK